MLNIPRNDFSFLKPVGGAKERTETLYRHHYNITNDYEMVHNRR